MKKPEELTRQQRAVFRFLNNLRDTGVTNMFGATPYIKQAFDLSKKDSTNLLVEWMEWGHKVEFPKEVLK